jgi:hypothetical protein
MNKCTYFSHDANARNDLKILQMRSVYGYQGYGWYWAIVESMREQEDFRISMRGQYVWDAIATALQCDCNMAQKFVDDCVNEFKLFESDGEFFWSDSLCQRMDKMNHKSKKARNSANVRWDDANVPHVGCDRIATAPQENESAREKKRKETKRKESKDLDHFPLSNEPVSDVVKQKGVLYTAGFLEFWTCYPRKVSKKNAQMAWAKVRPDEVLLQKMIAAIKDQMTSPQWTRDNGDSIPHPATWLNGERWTDETQKRIGSAGVDNSIRFDPEELEILKERERSERQAASSTGESRG